MEEKKFGTIFAMINQVGAQRDFWHGFGVHITCRLRKRRIFRPGPKAPFWLVKRWTSPSDVLKIHINYIDVRESKSCFKTCGTALDFAINFPTVCTRALSSIFDSLDESRVLVSAYDVAPHLPGRGDHDCAVGGRV